MKSKKISIVLAALVVTGAISFSLYSLYSRYFIKNPVVEASVTSSTKVNTSSKENNIPNTNQQAPPNNITTTTNNQTVKNNNNNNNSQAASNKPNANYKEIFKNDAFMGDSISEGLSFYEFLDDSNVFAKKGMSITKAKDEVDKVAATKPKNIYILYGVNDMDDTMSSQWFVDNYRDLINCIKAKLPTSNIYVQAVLPVSPEVEKRTPHINNKHINECNAGLMAMAKEENVKFVNIAEVLNGVKENLYEDDGIHFKTPFYPLWLNYLISQTK